MGSPYLHICGGGIDKGRDSALGKTYRCTRKTGEDR